MLRGSSASVTRRFPRLIFVRKHSQRCGSSRGYGLELSLIFKLWLWLYRIMAGHKLQQRHFHTPLVIVNQAAGAAASWTSVTQPFALFQYLCTIRRSLAFVPDAKFRTRECSSCIKIFIHGIHTSPQQHQRYKNN